VAGVADSAAALRGDEQMMVVREVHWSLMLYTHIFVYDFNVCVCMRRCVCTCICVCVYMCTSGRCTNILHSTSGRETALCKMYVSLPLHNFFFALCQMYSFEKLCRGKEHLLRLDLATL